MQLPYRTLYQIENIGTEPALRFEVNVVRARKLYPVEETPVPLAGFEYVNAAARSSPTTAASPTSSLGTTSGRSPATKGTTTKRAGSSG